MASHPLQAAADKYVLRMADVVLESVGAAREAVDLGRLEAALARRDADGAWFALEPAIDAADAVLRGDKASKAEGDALPTGGLGAVISATVEAGGNAVELCVLAPPVSTST